MFLELDFCDLLNSGIIYPSVQREGLIFFKMEISIQSLDTLNCSANWEERKGGDCPAGREQYLH